MNSNEAGPRRRAQRRRVTRVVNFIKGDDCIKNVIRSIPLALALAALFLSVGCTGARVVVMPDSKFIEPPTVKGCGKVAVTEISGEDKSKVPSDLVVAFAKYLEQSGLFGRSVLPCQIF